MKKSDWAPLYDRLSPFIDDAARTHYRGDRHKGFKFWAVGQVLMGMGLSDDALKDPLELDGRGDLGLDGYYEDADSETLILVQSKFHDKPVAVGNDDLNRFFASLRKILDPNVVVASKNPLAQDAHRGAREAIAKGWTLRFVFVTSGYLSPEGRVFAESKRDETEAIDSVVVRKELEVYDLEKLEEEYKRNLTPARLNTDVTLSIPRQDRHVSSIANFQVLVAAISARELVSAFRDHGYALFRLNPRYSLQQNTINSRIKKTLEDPASRKWFFHLNNGITALCDTFREENGSVHIRDLQIVNGCQTTVTLAKVAPIVEADPDVKVLLRVFEGLRGIPVNISEATNMQNRLTAQDRKSNDPLQQDLKRRFDALLSPVFYEVKRGDWQVEQVQGDPERYRDRQSNVYRRINMVDLAQATLAFLGEPGDAKDKPRSIFENESLYKKVFPDQVRPEQLLLPWYVYKEAERLCAEWTQFSGAPYARFCLTAIVGRELAPSKQLPSAHDASRLAAQADRIVTILRRGQQAITSLVAALDEEYPGHREFFRSGDFFQKIVRTYEAMPS